ncbi:hypothetical protein Trydic_g6780 [Trypoxylus dichotomus]
MQEALYLIARRDNTRSPTFQSGAPLGEFFILRNGESHKHSSLLNEGTAEETLRHISLHNDIHGGAFDIIPFVEINSITIYLSNVE